MHEPQPDQPVWTIWHGGGNYSRSDIEDVETWPSIEDALTEADNRKRVGHHFACDFAYAHKEPQRALTPCVDESSRVEVFLVDPVIDYDGSTIPDCVYEWDENCDEYVLAHDGDYVTR